MMLQVLFLDQQNQNKARVSQTDSKQSSSIFLSNCKDSILDDSRNLSNCGRSEPDSTVWNEDKYCYLRFLSKDEKDELAQDAIQCIY